MSATVRTRSPVRSPDPLRALLSRRGAILGSFLVLVFGVFVYRDEIGRQKLLLEARSAVDRGELELGESKLEEILERSPDFEEAANLVVGVSAELVVQALPLVLRARHDHRLGFCTGELTLHDWGVEYTSGKHGVWRWQFEAMRAIKRGSVGITLETHEADMLGLLGSKNYNFSVVGEPLRDELWKRYERLFRLRRISTDS